MHIKTKKRLYSWLWVIASWFIGLCIILYFLSDSISYFVTPTKLFEKDLSQQEVKLGGYVQGGSLKKISIDESEFIVTDRLHSVFVKYKGALPMIFREEQGVVVIGSFDSKSKIFYAKSVLAKHDEKYKPKKTQTQSLN